MCIIANVNVSIKGLVKGGKEMIFCTIATTSHLYRAKVLAISLKIYYPEAQFILCLVEKKTELDEPTRMCFDDVVFPSDFGIQHIRSQLFGYEANEACCSLKGELMSYVINRFPNEPFLIYLDSDIRIYSRMVEIEQALKDHTIILTPHQLGSPDPDSKFFGIYNTGFLALRQSEDTNRFLAWWKSKLRLHCYIDRKHNIFLDQSWLNELPTSIKPYILKHPGYNVAFWNLYEANRKFSLSQQGAYLVGGAPLRFVHFSRLFDSLAKAVKAYRGEGADIIKSLLYDYMVEIESTGLQQMISTPWSYHFYEDGQKISKRARECYRRDLAYQSTSYDPFQGYGREMKSIEERDTSPSSKNFPRKSIRKIRMRKRTFSAKRRSLGQIKRRLEAKWRLTFTRKRKVWVRKCKYSKT
jgi:hypothetical protein